MSSLYTGKLAGRPGGGNFNNSRAPSNTNFKPPSYLPTCAADDGSFEAGSFEYPSHCSEASSSVTQTSQFTPGTTMYGGSETGSIIGEGRTKTSRYKASHCGTCTCYSAAQDPAALKNANGRPYGRKQLQLAAKKALGTYNNTQDTTLQDDQMTVMRQSLKQLQMPWTNIIFQESSVFVEPSTEHNQNIWIRGFIDKNAGFPDTVRKAYEATCEGGTDNPRKGMKGAHARLEMASLASEDEGSDGSGESGNYDV